MAENEPSRPTDAGRALEGCANSANSAKTPSRRFPAPWSVVEAAEAYVVTDANGTKLAFSYFDTAERGANAIRWLKPEARQLMDAIARLPELLKGEGSPTVQMPIHAPWTVQDRGDWLRVTDAAGHSVCDVYVESPRAGSLTWDEARRIANGIAKLPGLVG
jgi:hypothetical protein